MTLITHSGADRTTRAALSLLTTPPPMGRHHMPVPHADLLDALEASLSRRGVQILDQAIATGGKITHPNGAIYTSTTLFAWLRLSVDTPSPDGTAMHTQLGVRSCNMQRSAITIVAGRTVTVCDNWLLLGNPIAFRKHTTGVRLTTLIDEALDKLPAADAALTRTLDTMSRHLLSLDAARLLLYRAFVEERTAPLRLLPKAHDIYDSNAYNDDRRAPDVRPTRLGLYNAYTRAIQDLPSLQRRAECSQAGMPIFAGDPR